MDERLRFVARRLDGESMTALCAEFGISRKTGYKIFDRYKDYGVHGLSDRSRRPYRHANQLPLVIETGIVRLNRQYPDWGAPKIREKLRGRTARRGVPRSAPCTRCSIDTAWCNAAAADDAGRPGRPSRTRARRMRSGARTTTASFGSAIGSTAIR